MKTKFKMFNTNRQWPQFCCMTTITTMKIELNVFIACIFSIL